MSELLSLVLSNASARNSDKMSLAAANSDSIFYPWTSVDS